MNKQNEAQASPLTQLFCPQVLIAVGRDACTEKIGLDKAGVKVNPKYVYCLVVYIFFFFFCASPPPSNRVTCAFKTGHSHDDSANIAVPWLSAGVVRNCMEGFNGGEKEAGLDEQHEKGPL